VLRVATYKFLLHAKPLTTDMFLPVMRGLVYPPRERNPRKLHHLPAAHSYPFRCRADILEGQ